jgi:hypothetical protein
MAVTGTGTHAAQPKTVIRASFCDQVSEQAKLMPI